MGRIITDVNKILQFASFTNETCNLFSVQSDVPVSFVNGFSFLLFPSLLTVTPRTVMMGLGSIQITPLDVTT